MEEGDCNTVLGLGLSIGHHYVPKVQQPDKNKSAVCLDLSFTLWPKQQDDDEQGKTVSARKGSSLKFGDEEEEEDSSNKIIDFISFNNYKNTRSRKKLRLTKDQSALLEESFKQHSTLNPVQKHELAERLNLTPRQVEVWFQNRRARTKLKQTEVDCEFLKKCCESLSDENSRLKKELQELKALKFGRSAPLCLQLPMRCKETAPFGRGPQLNSSNK